MRPVLYGRTVWGVSVEFVPRGKDTKPLNEAYLTLLPVKAGVEGGPRLQNDMGSVAEEGGVSRDA